jgi:hypothetical protein
MSTLRLRARRPFLDLLLRCSFSCTFGVPPAPGGCEVHCIDGSLPMIYSLLHLVGTP